MTAAQSTTTTTIECGFCLMKDEALPEPKVLPCKHIHCLDCLNGYFEENHTILCPVQDCGEVFNGSPEALPSHGMEGDDNSCDACPKNETTKQEAVIYCAVCCKKFCRKHQQDHDSALIDHSKISMEEYSAQAMQKQTTDCEKHENQAYVLACKLCLTLSCVKCVPELGLCDNGASHGLLSLDDFVAALMKEEIIAEMVSKENQYERLFKATSKAIAEYDSETTAMIELIHETRDAQVEALKLEYKKLEEVIEKRQKSRIDLAEFMEDIVLKKWTQLRNHRRMMESRVKGTQLADVVKGYKEMKGQMQELVEEELPKLQLVDELKLNTLDENRDMKLGIVFSDGIVIDSERGVTTFKHLPQSVTPLESVQLPAALLSVCHYNGSTYVGLKDGTVSRIDDNYQLHNSFISTSGPVETISVYKDRFYTLSQSSPRVVNIHDTSGGHITSWTHPYHSSRSNVLTVVADQVVIADPPNKRITVYSLTGNSLRHIPCPLLSNTFIALCAVDNTSVVISNCLTSKVFRVHITTGEVMWTLSDAQYPDGLVRYGRYILVAGYNNTIYVLDISTGKIVSEMLSKRADDAIKVENGSVEGLEVYGTTLVATKYDKREALFIQLNTQLLDI